MAKYKKRADGRYISRVPIGKDEDGKTVYKWSWPGPSPSLSLP